jgi:hypothetical protein
MYIDFCLNGQIKNPSPLPLDAIAAYVGKEQIRKIICMKRSNIERAGFRVKSLVGKQIE